MDELPKPDLANTSANRECPLAHDPRVLRKGVQRTEAPASIDGGSPGKPSFGSHDSLLPQDTMETTVLGWFSGEDDSFCGMSPDPYPTLMPVPDEPPMPFFLKDARLPQ
mmetsp:Transcript_138274/g.385728  ORF Transcript_138274/g.385728 Transcript_138274/m.385728 type:complete len:109 (-) Transcript_138274:169-495(-)